MEMSAYQLCRRSRMIAPGLRDLRPPGRVALASSQISRINREFEQLDEMSKPHAVPVEHDALDHHSTGS